MSKLGQILLFFGLVFMIAWFVALGAVNGANYPFVWVLLGVGILALLGAIYKDLGFFISLAGQRTTKHGLNLGALLVIVIAILVGVNFIGFRHVKKFDYTKEKINSLSEQTKSVVKALDSELIVKAFFAENQQQKDGEKQKFKEISDLYASESSKIKATFIDPIKRPDEAKANDVNVSGTIALEYKGHKAKFEDLTEQGFTNAIIKITRGKNKSIYFVTGHGERQTDDAQVSGIQNFKKYLVDASYDVKSFSFVETQKVPDDAAVIIIAGPKNAFFDPEIKAVKDYLYKGGKILLALDPGSKTNLGALTQELGIEFKNNYILDPFGQMVGGGAATVIGMNFSQSSDITSRFSQGMTIFHLASQLKATKDKPANITVEEIVRSTDKSFTKADIKNPRPHYEEGRDEKGPLGIVLSSVGKLKEEPGSPAPQEFGVIVVGDSDFMTNQLVDAQLNHDLTLNIVASLAKDKELVSIAPKASVSTSVMMTAFQRMLFFCILVIGIPALLFFAGCTVWYRRRTA